MTKDPNALSTTPSTGVPASGQFVAGGESVAPGNGWRWVAAGWSLFTRAPGVWVLIALALVVLLVVVGLLPVVGNLALTVLWPILLGGLMLGCRDLDRGAPLTFGHLFAGFRDKAGPLALIGALTLVGIGIAALLAVLVTGVGVGTASSLVGDLEDLDSGAAVTGVALVVLVILALMLPVYMATWFAPALVVFEGYGVAAALRGSFRATVRNIVPFLVYGLILFPLAVVATLPFGLGWLVLAPVVVASVYASYRDIHHGL
jgi:uncharacterized membrane protein